MKVTKDIKKITATQTALSRALGITRPYISQLIQQGVIVRDGADPLGGVLLFDSVKNFYSNKARAAGGDEEINIERERALHEVADRKIAELRLAKMDGSVYDARTVELVQTEMLSNLRTQLLGLPTKLAPILEGKGKEEIYALMTAELEEKLKELSEYTPEQYLEEEAVDREDSG